MRNMIKPPPSPIHGEGESLSEWFCHLSTLEPSECSSLSVPFAELAMSYMDDTSDDALSQSLQGENCEELRRMTNDSIRGKCPVNLIDPFDYYWWLYIPGVRVLELLICNELLNIFLRSYCNALLIFASFVILFHDFRSSNCGFLTFLSHLIPVPPIGFLIFHSFF